MPSECTIVRAIGRTADRLKAQEADQLYERGENTNIVVAGTVGM